MILKVFLMLWSFNACVCADICTEWIEDAFDNPLIEKKVTVSLTRKTPMDGLRLAARVGLDPIQHCYVVWDVSAVRVISEEESMWEGLHQLFRAGIKDRYCTTLSVSDSRRMDRIVEQLKEDLICLTDVSFPIGGTALEANFLDLVPRQWSVDGHLFPYPPEGTLRVGVKGLPLKLQGVIIHS